MKIKRFFIFVLLACSLSLGSSQFVPVMAQGSSPSSQGDGTTGDLQESPTGSSQSPTETNSQTAPNAQDQPAARQGVPSFWQSVDTTYATWSAYIQGHYPWYGIVAISAVLAYVTGLITFKLLFVIGKFGPDAAAIGMWTLTFVLLCCALILSPLTWPWWSPLAWIVGWIVLTLLLVSTLSKKSTV